MRVAVFGAGAMGTVLGAYLSAAGAQIHLITRNISHVQALNERGAHVGGYADFTVKVRAFTPEDIEGEYDLIFLAAKQTGNAEIAERLKGMLAREGAVCTIQNGLPEYALEKVLGGERVLGCVCSWGASLISPGEAELTSSPDRLCFQLGSPFENANRIDAAEALLSLMGKVERPANFLGARWTKLIINCAFSPLSGMSGLTFGQIAKNKRSRAIAQELFNEGVKVCRAEGVTPARIQGRDAVKWLGYKGKVKKAVSFALFPVAMKRHKNVLSGIYYDLSNGRKSEAEDMSGVILSRGERRGVSTPYTKKALEIIGRIESGELGISPENFKLF